MALCAMLVDLATRLPAERLPEAAAPTLAALAAWQAQPDEASVQAATAALTLLPAAEPGRYRPSIYRALECAVESLSPPHPPRGWSPRSVTPSTGRAAPTCRIASQR